MLYEPINKNAAIMNVLLVDDDRDDYLIFAEALLYQNIKTNLNTVNNGDLLFELLDNKSIKLPDIIFLDVNMPGKNGYDCLIQMKESEILGQIPIVMYSTNYQEFVADVLYNMGADFYIKKPKSFTDVKNVIEKALGYVAKTNQHVSRENFVL